MCATAWLSLPIAILPSGTSTAAVMPACAAYAAAEADVLPVDAQMTAFAPCSIGRRDGDGHAAVLERAGGVHALELHPHVGAGAARQRGSGQQRGAALAEGDDGRGVGDVQTVGVLAEDSAPDDVPLSVSFTRAQLGDGRDASTTPLAASRSTVSLRSCSTGLVRADDEGGDAGTPLGATVCSTVAIETRRLG